ncbi:flagellar biosynthetic protein FliO [Pseudoalteromonas spongiae]|uniref:flagellar biosynthetic protein FliO n=1 Tax=Pseudoalteromonas spongiae TaxID=298657 RepID=UPI000C2D1E2C|nr:flagellar biosynthetic protein FliO [Pseudoalteromonas spongiae]
MKKNIGLLSTLLIVPFNLLAAESAGFQQLASMIMSLLLVVGCIVLLAVLIKRFNPQMTPSDEFKVIRSINIGSKERLLVVEMDNKHHVLGVTSGSINYLYQLETPLAEQQMPEFAKQLAHFMNPKNKK